MDFVALFDEELCEEGAVLARYPGDECDLVHVSISIGLIYSVCCRDLSSFLRKEGKSPWSRG